LDGVAFSLIGIFAIFLGVQFGSWEGLLPDAPWFLDFAEHPNIALASLALIVAGAGYLHYRIRRFAAKGIARWLAEQSDDPLLSQGLRGAFAKSTGIWRSLFSTRPSGWRTGARKRLHRIAGEADRFVQRLNDTYANPSGKSAPRVGTLSGDDAVVTPLTSAEERDPSPVSTHHNGDRQDTRT
jgi:hypothetical protein